MTPSPDLAAIVAADEELLAVSIGDASDRGPIMKGHDGL
jgi:hypothetical protein